MLEESFDDIKQSVRQNCPLFFCATLSGVLRIELEEVGFTVFLLVAFTGDITTFGDEALPELFDEGEDFGGPFLVAVEEFEQEDFEGGTGLLGRVLLEPLKPCTFDIRATLPATVAII